MVRTPCCDKSGLRKGTWTPEEDMKLISYVTRYGCWNWRQLPKYAGLARCGKSCRLRWMNYLRPDLKHGKFTPEEDELIIKLHESLGNRWSAIAAQLPGRSDNEIKNHWHTSLKNASKKATGESERRPKNRKRKSIGINEISNHPPTLRAQEILESSEFASQPTFPSSSLLLSSAAASSHYLSSSFSPAAISTDHFVIDALGGYDDFTSDLEREYSGGSFWTEPFLMDSDITVINYPSSPFATDGLLCSYDFYDHYSENLELW